MMKMRIKKDILSRFLPVIAVLCFVLPAPAFAEMKKVDEGELARTNASVTGASVQDRTVGVEKDVVRQETILANGPVDKGDSVISSVQVLEGIGLSLNIKGQETFKFQVGGIITNTTGGITSVKSH